VTELAGFDPAGDLAIDDLRFADLLRIALEDAPGASQGRWTLHGPVDAGVTLLELFAWQLEQRLFMAEQVTAPVVRASLRLLGLADPSPTRAATTVLCFQPGPAAATLPAGTLMNLECDTLGRGVTLDEPVTVLPMGPVEVGGRLLAAGDQLELAHDRLGPQLAGRPVSLLVDLPGAPGVAPEWSRAAVAVPPAAELRWTAVGPDGTGTAVTVADGTGGFRRSGLLRLAWPEVWDRLGGGRCRLRARAVRGGWTEAVAVRGVYPNAVRATHRQPRQVDVSAQLRALLPLPGQRLRLPGTAGALLDGPGDLWLRLTEVDGSEHTWTSVADWTWVGPDERVLVVDRARGELVFGDGRSGRIPRPGPAATATVGYALGGGTAGNVGAGSAWARDGGAELASNPLPAEGGAEGEPLAAAAQRAAADLARADRTVTAADATELVLATPGVGLQRAHASLGLHPDFPCVEVPTALSVTVVPAAAREATPAGWTRAPRPDAGALAAAQAQLAGGRLLGQEVFVLPPAYRRVTVWATVSQTARGQTVEARVTEALLRFLDPLEGGSDGRGWPFGAAVRPSALIGVVRTALGPESEVVSLAVALDDEPPTDCADLPIGPRELVWLAGVHLSWVTAVPAGGGLQ
jgi:hypothetical protein